MTGNTMNKSQETLNTEPHSPQDWPKDLEKLQGCFTVISTTQNEDVLSQEESPAAAFLRQHDEWADYDEAEATRVRWKIDLRLIPLIMVTTTLAATDKILISNAALYGMNKDLHLHGQQYSWASSIFCFGWLVAEFPANALLQKLPVGKAAGCAMLIWGSIVACHAAVQSSTGLLIARFFLGLTESPLFPAIAILNSMWYKRSEQPLRTALSFTTGYSLINGIVSYGIGHAHAKIADWRLLFLIFGLATILWGVVLIIWLPDSPTSDSFLRGREKYIALDRVKDNMTGIEDKTLKWYQVREALTDYKTYLLFMFFLCMHLPTGGLISFSAQIISGFGYNKLTTVLLGLPTCLIQGFAGLLVAVPQRWMTNKRCLSIALCCLFPLICAALLRNLPYDNRVGLLISYYIFYMFWGTHATALSLPMANTSGHTKRLTVNAVIFLAFTVANIVGPQIFLSKEAPHYKMGYSIIMGGEVVAMCCMALYALGCMWENRRNLAKDGAVVEVSVREQLGDKTDKEKRGFVYVY